MNMETVATLGLSGKISDSSVTVNTTSDQNMAVAGDVHVTFQNWQKVFFYTVLWYLIVSADLLVKISLENTT